MIVLSSSPIHLKGALTLGLLLLAESVSLSNAIKIENLFKNNNDGIYGTPFGDHKKQKKSTTTSTIVLEERLSLCERDLKSCKSSNKFTPIKFLQSKLSNNNNKKQGGDQQCLDIPRGGHGAHTAAQTVVDAATSAGTGVTPYGIPLHLWKVLFQTFLTALNVLCWLIPLRSKKISENKLALSLANAFSGGVFLSLAFGHLIPECANNFPQGYNDVTPFLLVMVGYLVIFFVEKVAFDAHDILHEMEHAGEQQQKQQNSHGGKKKQNGKANGDVTPATTPPPVGRSAVILLGALAVHSILEMTALGLADTFGESALLTLSIALHQPAESIALLVAFLKSGMPKNQIIQFLSIFSAMGPIGVAIGMAVNEFAAPIVDASMIAIVAGTFIYVGATEVIPEEWEDSANKWKKFTALMAGIISILIITQYTETLGLH